MKMKLNLKQQKVSLDLSSRTILTKDHSKLLNIEAHVSGHTGFVYDEDFVAYQEKAKTTTDNLQTQIDNLDVGYITEEEMQQHLAEQAVVDKAQDDALNAEVTNREEADMALQNNINTETKAREQGDSDLQTALSVEATDRIKDDDALNSKIEDETERATNAENTLQSHIDAHHADQAVINATLQDKDDELNTAIENVDNKLDDETSTRQATDTTLQNNINTNTTLISDFSLNTQKSLSTLGTQLDEETSNRKSADSALDTRLSSAETGLTTETTNRIKDDDTLHDLIVAKQDKLVSGSNIKTINDQSIVGAGNISIAGGLFELVGKDVDELTITKSETYFITSVTYKIYVINENVNASFYGSALVSTIGFGGIPHITISGVAYQLPRRTVTLLTQGKMNVYKMREE